MGTCDCSPSTKLTNQLKIIEITQISISFVYLSCLYFSFTKLKLSPNIAFAHTNPLSSKMLVPRVIAVNKQLYLKEASF